MTLDELTALVRDSRRTARIEAQDGYIAASPLPSLVHRLASALEALIQIARAAQPIRTLVAVLDGVVDGYDDAEPVLDTPVTVGDLRRLDDALARLDTPGGGT